MRVPSATALAPLAAVILLAGCGGNEETTGPDPAPTEAVAEATGRTVEAPEPPDVDEGAGRPPAKDESRGPRREGPTAQPSVAEKTDASEAAEAAYRAYVEAINERDGEALCELLPPTAEKQLRPPVQGGSCGERLGQSIGYEDPRGYPVWTRTTLNGVPGVSIGSDPSTARLTAAIVTQFEGREPSVESDVAYLELVGGEWRLAQPTAALYRAIGRPELPPSVIAPPPG